MSAFMIPSWVDRSSRCQPTSQAAEVDSLYLRLTAAASPSPRCATAGNAFLPLEEILPALAEAIRTIPRDRPLERWAQQDPEDACVRAMHLDRAWADPERPGDRLVGPSFERAVQHLPLAQGQLASVAVRSPPVPARISPSVEATVVNGVSGALGLREVGGAHSGKLP